MSNLKKIIIFEGCDACGKTTTIENFKAYLVNEKGLKVYNPRFPRYDTNAKGLKLKNHIHKFDYKTLSKKVLPESILKELESNSVNQMINKMDSIDNVISEIEDRDCDVVLIDRFVLSQYIYDAAWFEILTSLLNSNNIFTEDYKNVFTEQLKAYCKRAEARAEITWESFKTAIKFAFGEDVSFTQVILTKSKYIDNIIEYKKENDKLDRRIDKYDELSEYQKWINNYFRDNGKLSFKPEFDHCMQYTIDDAIHKFWTNKLKENQTILTSEETEKIFDPEFIYEKFTKSYVKETLEGIINETLYKEIYYDGEK